MFSSYAEMKKWVTQLNRRPRLLLHSCCAPCSSHTILFLHRYFDVTVYYSNDNLFPLSEFQKRLEEQKRLIRLLNLDIPVLEDGWNSEDYEQAVLGVEHLGEKSIRCYRCYELRLRKTALKAKESKFDFFTTTLSISPHKNSVWINEIGKELEKETGVSFLYSDFKKEDGFHHSVELSKQYRLYRQNYCGCQYSYAESRQKNGTNEKNENITTESRSE